MKLVVFDMDGTLIDSGYDITASINYVRKKLYALEPLEVQKVIDIINAPKRNLAKLFYEVDEYELDAKEMFEKHYEDECVKNIYAYAGIEELLSYLKKNGYLLAVATNAPTFFAQKMLSYLNLSEYFSIIVGADMVKNPKPHSEMLEYIFKELQIDKDDAKIVMVGDNSKDMDCAKAANVDGVFAGWGFSSEYDGAKLASKPQDILQYV